MINKVIGFGILTSLGLIGCANDASDQTVAKSAQPLAASAAIGSPVPVVHYTPPKRDDSDVASKTASLFGAFGRKVSTGAIKLAHLTADGSGAAQTLRIETALASEPCVMAKYEPRDDSFEVYDTASFGTDGPSASDLDLAGAKAVFLATYANVVNRGLAVGSRSDVAKVLTREIHCADGTESGPGRAWIDEYMFFVPTQVSGIPIGSVTQEYGLIVNVHRSGKVRRIAVTGAALAADEGNALTIVGNTSKHARATSAASLVRRRVGAADVTEIGDRYVIDEDAPGGDLIPRTLHRVVPASTKAGQPSTGKAMIASHAIDDSSDTIAILPQIGGADAKPK